MSDLRNFKDIKAELSVGKMIGVLVFVIIAMALLPTIITSVNAGANATTGTSHTLVPLITVFYVIAVLVGVVMWVVHESKESGLS